MIDALTNNRFVSHFGLTAPIALAPMALATGGELAAACAKAGALSLVGGAYGDLEWTRREYSLALDALSAEASALARLGCGFISWKLAEDRSALDWVLDQEHQPTAIMLSFGDPSGLALSITDRDIPLICQIQAMSQLPQAIDAGASVIVAQGGEAGGHGLNARDGRSTFTFVPEIADRLAAHNPEIMLLAAGGIADGRGLAAATMLGADGALVGSRLWATRESLAPAKAIAEAVRSDGNSTARSSIFDILREKNWPSEFDFRALRNDIHREWEERIDDLRESPKPARESYRDGVLNQDYTRAHVTVGEATGLIYKLESAGDVIRSMNRQARQLTA